jgi:hypothetical protein
MQRIDRRDGGVAAAPLAAGRLVAGAAAATGSSTAPCGSKDLNPHRRQAGGAPVATSRSSARSSSARVCPATVLQQRRRVAAAVAVSIPALIV